MNQLINHKKGDVCPEAPKLSNRTLSKSVFASAPERVQIDMRIAFSTTVGTKSSGAVKP